MANKEEIFDEIGEMDKLNKIEVSAKGEEKKEFTFSTTNLNQSTITVTSDSNWITNIKVEDGKITFDTTENTTPDDRTATITVTAMDDEGNFVLIRTDVYQIATEATAFSSLHIETTEYTVDSKAQSFTIPFSATNISNIEFVVDGGEEWCKPSFNNNLIVVNVAQNNTTAERVGTFTIYGISSIGGQVTDMYDIIVTQQSASGGEIWFEPDDILRGYQSSNGNIICHWDNVNLTTIQPIGKGEWLTLTLPPYAPTATTGTFQAFYQMTENVDSDRQATLLVGGTAVADGRLVSKLLRFKQLSSPKIYEFPIWKDTIIDIPTDDEYVDYFITYNGEKIFEGRAYQIGGKTEVKVNEIISDYVNDYMDFSKIYNDNQSYVDFNFYIEGNEMYILRTYNDWSYTDETADVLKNGNIAQLSRPVTNEVDINQYFLFSVFAPKGKSATNLISYVNNAVALRYSPRDKIATEIIPIRNFPTAKTIRMSGEGINEEYKVLCGNKYCLYFLNRFGGWDSILMKGNATMKHTFNRSSFKQNALNYDINRNTVNYLNNIKESWKLNTEYLNDEESERFAYAMGSNKLYLHLLEDDKIIPINITDSNVEFKTFKNQGRKFARYTIEVENAKDKKIR